MRFAMDRKGTSVLALLAVVLTLGTLWFTKQPLMTKKPTWEDAAAQAQNGGYRLITATEMAALYRQDPQMLIVDTREDWEYRTGHIMGALNFPMEATWWSRWRSQGPLARFLGPDLDRPIVFYCGGLT